MLSSLLWLLCLTLCRSEIKITDSGTGPIGKDDMALIFFITLENTCDKDVEITVNMIHCCEETSKTQEKDCKSIYLLGGDMGILADKLVRNITLIYPNLYLANREGECTVSIGYKADTSEHTIIHEIKFCTKVTNGTKEEEQCSTLDQDVSNNCSPVDCVMKYNGERSFFNLGCGECEEVPLCLDDPTKCLPEVSYSLITNNCTDLNSSITTFDLEFLEREIVDTNEDICSTNNLICHQGVLDVDGQCQCYKDWVTSINENEDYFPTSLHYHMCNIEMGAWNSLNKDRIKTTAVIISILAATIVSKIIILMCVLNWCYKHFRKPQEKTCTEQPGDFDDSLILCEQMDVPVDKCVCKGLSSQKLPVLTNETVNVCYYPCRPSTTTTEGRPDKSISLSKTTSSSGRASNQSETDCECSSEESDSSDEDYEIQFSEEHLSDRFEEEDQGEEQSDHSARNPEDSSGSQPNSGGSKDLVNESGRAGESKNMSKQSESSTRDIQ